MKERISDIEEGPIAFERFKNAMQKIVSVPKSAVHSTNGHKKAHSSRRRKSSKRLPVTRPN